MFPVLVAMVIWGSFFRNKRILPFSDNKGVVFAINTLSSKCERVVRLLRYLVLCCLSFNIWLKAKYIEGKSNVIADSLSRFQWSRFRELAPTAEEVGVPCPPHLWDLVLE